MRCVESATATDQATATAFENTENLYAPHQIDVRSGASRLSDSLAGVESQTYAMDTTDFTTVTDMKNWAVLDGIGEPTMLYQLRLERVDAAVRSIEAEYAQRIRQLPYTVQVRSATSTPPAEARVNHLQGGPRKLSTHSKPENCRLRPDTSKRSYL